MKSSVKCYAVIYCINGAWHGDAEWWLSRRRAEEHAQSMEWALFKVIPLTIWSGTHLSISILRDLVAKRTRLTRKTKGMQHA